MTLNSRADIEAAFEQLRSHNLIDLFTQSLGWSAANEHSPTQVLNQKCWPIAKRDAVVVWQVPLAKQTRFTPNLRHQIYQHLSEQALSGVSDESPLVIFSTSDRRRSLWCQSANESALYVVGQPVLSWLFRLRRLAKIARGLFPTMTSELLQDETFDSFAFEQLAEAIERGIRGIENAHDRQMYGLSILQRLVFVQQLQQKGWLEGDTWYLQTRFQSQFFSTCLQPLFRALSLPVVERPLALQASVGEVPFVGLFFQTCALEEKYPAATIEDSAFENTLGWLSEQASADTLNPWMSGALDHWLDVYWRRRSGVEHVVVGRTELAKDLCDLTLDRLLLDRLSVFPQSGVVKTCRHGKKESKQKDIDRLRSTQETSQTQTLNDVLFNANTQVCRHLIQEILPTLRMVDPCCGSGLLLVSFHQRLTDIFSVLTGYIQQNQDAQLKIWHSALAKPSIASSLKALPDKNSDKITEEISEGPLANSGLVLKNIQERVLKNTIHGVASSAEIATSVHFQLLLHLVATAQRVEEIEPLIDLEFNVMAGDALVGFIAVDEERFDQVNTSGSGSGSGSVFQGNLLQPLAADSYQTILSEKNIALEYYQSRSQTLASAHNIPPYARAALLREEILTLDHRAQQKLDTLLLSHMSQQLGIRYRETQLASKPVRRPLNLQDIQSLKPFHWGYYFNSIFRQGGFDIVVCLPPGGAYKPTTAEFIVQHRDLAARKSLNSKTLKTSKRALKQADSDVAQSWLCYQDRYAYLTDYFGRSELYCHQLSSSESKKSRYPLDKTMLFVEQCYNLLSEKGVGGLMVPVKMLKDDGVRSLLQGSSALNAGGTDKITDCVHSVGDVAILSWMK
ncbi:MAG: hypothetical protein AAFZ17_12770 [Cyanobacteria bacterium J06650_10]